MIADEFPSSWPVQVADAALPIGVHDELVELGRHRRTVLIGEASHGTAEFYAERAAITRRLIEECGYRAVAIEGDWPDVWRVNEYVTGRGTDHLAIEALDGFRRFPAWMWRNAEMLEFVGWLRQYNHALPRRDQAFIYGLDLYSMHTSAAHVLEYLERVDPSAMSAARRRYECLDGTDPDPQRYGREVMLGIRPDCERELLEQLVELAKYRGAGVAEEPIAWDSDDSWFNAQQNARVVRTAERYYRAMFQRDEDTWNLRDRHMAETLVRQQLRQARRLGSDRTVVWAHNSHVGDARGTEMGRRGQWTLGQLVRQEQGDECLLIGMTTHHGTVTAATDWEEPAEIRHVRPALAGSHEALFHQTGLGSFVLLPDEMRRLEPLQAALLERAIGVVYRPDTERYSHYFHAQLARQFDAVIHIDETQALEPLDRTAPRVTDEMAETWPFGT